MPFKKDSKVISETDIVDPNDIDFSGRCRVLGENIRFERKARGFSMHDVATYLDLSDSYVGLLERGIRSPGLKNFFNMCDLFSATPNELLLPREGTKKLKVAERGYKTANPNHAEAVQSLLRNLSDEEMEFVTTILKGLHELKRSQ